MRIKNCEFWLQIIYLMQMQDFLGLVKEVEHTPQHLTDHTLGTIQQAYGLLPDQTTVSLAMFRLA